MKPMNDDREHAGMEMLGGLLFIGWAVVMASICALVVSLLLNDVQKVVDTIMALVTRIQ